jgi:hypothetical protein
VASLALSPVHAIPFVAAMLAGMLLQKITMERRVTS